MKKIRIFPMLTAEQLSSIINVREKKEVNAVITKPEDEFRKRDALVKIHKLITENIGKGHIQSKSMPELEIPATVTTNILTKDKIPFQFPEPNPIHLYFQNACNRLEKGKYLLKELKKIDILDHTAQYKKYCEYFYEVNDGITLLISSVEGHINQLIPENIQITFSTDAEPKKEDIWSKEDMLWKDLKTKIKKILPYITGTNFCKTNATDYQRILALQVTRNKLIHLKTIFQNNYTFYEQLMKELLDFDGKIYVDSVYNFLNYYIPNYIQEEIIEN
jgi:hypothetical protein